MRDCECYQVGGRFIDVDPTCEAHNPPPRAMTTSDTVEKYEEVASAFYAATGVIAPGKDIPAAMGGYDEDTLRYKMWVLFLNTRTQLAAAERERDAMKQLIAMQDVWEGEAIHDITALVTERKELRTRAERAEAEAEIVRRARRNGNVLVEVSRKLLELGEFTTNPLYVMLTDNEDGTHMLTFRALSTGHQGGA